MKTTYLLFGLLALGTAAPAWADQVFTDDVVISGPDAAPGRLCVGEDCADGETFPSGTFDGVIKMSANNNIIDFNDTSGSSFPDRDWRIQANETSGTEAFFIEDMTEGSKPFYITGSAPSNALFIAADGDIGLGTTLPGEELHVTGASPNLRLEDTSSPFYTWDVGGNQGVFFVEDVTAITFPFRIFAGAPDGSFAITSSGNVGLGLTSASTGLHVKKSDGTGAILVEESSAGTLGQLTLRNNGITFFTLEDTSIADVDNSGRKWNFQNQAGTFRVTTAPGGPGVIEMILTPAGDMTIEGALTQNSDKNKKMAIEPVDPAAILQKVAELPVSSWMYKDNADLGIRHIGPMAQDFHAAFGVGASETGISSLDTSGVALAAIQALAQEVAALETLEEQNAALLDTVAALTARIEALESN
ncbi:tail fiber domain-containing protein [Roseovarius faecimaris]|nr:tail fiber domain-containing protein [Roseovarius faecimaris]